MGIPLLAKWHLDIERAPENLYPSVKTKPVLSKVQNRGSPNRPPMVDGWVVRIIFGWSVYVVVRNDDKTLITNSMPFVFHNHQGLYPKISLSLGRTRFLFKVLQSSWNLIGGPLPVVSSCLSNFKAIGVFFPNYTHLLSCEKIRRKFISRKTDHSRCKYGLPVTFMGRIWRPSLDSTAKLINLFLYQTAKCSYTRDPETNSSYPIKTQIHVLYLHHQHWTCFLFLFFIDDIVRAFCFLFFFTR